MMFFNFALSILSASVVWGKTEISLNREVEVSARENITWADLVSVSGGNEEVLRGLTQIPWLEEANLPTVVREHHEINDLAGEKGVQWNLPQKVSLKKVNGYSSAEFRRKFLNRLSALCQDCKFELRSVQDNKVRLTADWTIDNTAVKPAASLLVPVTSANAATAWIAVQMRVQRPALVLKHSIPIGQKILIEDVELKLADVSFSRETPVRMEDLNQVVALRSLASGQSLFPADLKKEELVKRGQNVKLMMGTEEYEISVNGIAEENGRFGDLVKVKNTESGKTLSGQVSGTGLVRLQ